MVAVVERFCDHVYASRRRSESVSQSTVSDNMLRSPLIHLRETGKKAKDPMRWLYEVRYKVELREYEINIT